MLQDYFEDFVLLERTAADDDLGGVSETWAEGLRFRGAVTQVVGKEVAPAGLTALKTVPMLLHEWDVTLRQDDRVRRVSDGAEFRVTGRSGDMRTPAISGMAFCQVPVERLVLA